MTRSLVKSLSHLRNSHKLWKSKELTLSSPIYSVAMEARPTSLMLYIMLLDEIKQ